MPGSRTVVALLAMCAVVAAAVALAACGRSPDRAETPSAVDGWHEFKGSWTAAGSRRVIALGGERSAALIDLKGSLLLAGPSRPGVGFRAEALALTDSATGMVGRAVWTDEHGDEVYSELRGVGTATGNRIDGTFLGGTGRYTGATGTYVFSWQYVLEAEDGAVQGRAVGLTGRVRVGQPQQTPPVRPPETKP